MSSGVSLGNIGSIGLASQEQLDYFTSKFGSHPKSLKDQYLEDRATLARLRITPKQIADRCEVIFLKAMDLYNKQSSSNPLAICNSAIIEGKFKITGFAIRAMCEPTPCPFTVDRPCGYGSAGFRIKNIRSREVIKVSDLQLHIIRDHKFFARSGSPARIDPSLACRVLDLSPGVDYSKELQVRDVWEAVRSNGYKGSTCPEVHKKTLETTAVESKAIDPQTTAYLMKTRYVEPDPKPETTELPEWYSEMFESGEFFIPLIEDEEEVEGELYLHIVGGNTEFKKNVEVFGRRIESLFGTKDHLSVLKASTEKFAVAGPEDHLKFTSLFKDRD